MDPMAAALWAGVERSDAFVRVFTRHLDEDDWRRTPAGFPNCPLWVLGHVAFYRGLFLELLTGARVCPDEWRPLFSMGCVPPDPGQLPDPARCFDELDRRREDWRAYLEQATAQSLQAPLETPNRFFDTRLDVVVHLSHHEAHHTGGLSMLSRALGRERIV